MKSNIRDIETTDISWILMLNELHTVELSALSEPQLVRLIDNATHTRAIDERAAFMIAFDQDADYDSPNFRWFKDRRARFVYIDRIAVSSSQRGQGLARRLYEDLFRQSLQRGHDRVVCEVNSDPPNPASDAFHRALGFKVIGKALLEDSGKTVRYMEFALTHA